jgi:hypothetical protein
MNKLYWAYIQEEVIIEQFQIHRNHDNASIQATTIIVATGGMMTTTVG